MPPFRNGRNVCLALLLVSPVATAAAAAQSAPVRWSAQIGEPIHNTGDGAKSTAPLAVNHRVIFGSADHAEGRGVYVGTSGGTIVAIGH